MGAPLSFLASRFIGRLQGVARDVAHVKKPMDSTASELKYAAESARRADSGAARRVAGTTLHGRHARPPVVRPQVRGRHRRPEVFYGTASDGSTVSFTVRDVRSVLLRDSHRRVNGVAFPTRPDDISHLTDWAARQNAVRDREVLPLRAVTEADGTVQFYPGAPVPYSAAEIAKGQPVLVAAHASPHSFGIGVNIGSRESPIWTTVDVDGGTFAAVATSTDRFVRAAGTAAPQTPLMLVSCDAAGWGGSAATSAAKGFHAAGFTGDVRAARGTVFTDSTEHKARGEAPIGVVETVDPAGNPLPLIETFPGAEVPEVPSGRHRATGLN